MPLVTANHCTNTPTTARAVVGVLGGNNAAAGGINIVNFTASGSVGATNTSTNATCDSSIIDLGLRLDEAIAAVVADVVVCKILHDKGDARLAFVGLNQLNYPVEV
jgi:hypothetical protein